MPAPHTRIDYKGIASAIFVVALTTAVGWPLYHEFHLANTNILMLYLVGVLWIATHHSQTAAVVTSIAGVLAFDFTFTPPYYHLTVDNPGYLVTLAVMLATALTISTLTHRMRVREKEAREAWERVEVEFLRNTLLSGVSHELRTPLAAITGASSALIEAGDQLSADAKAQMLDTVYTESERMERLITNLLDITRMESGGLVLKKEPQTLDAIIGAALQRLERRLHGRQITTNIQPNLPPVEIDALAIEQVIVNLLDNAIEYTPQGSAVEINVHRAANDVMVEVADKGPGLPPGTENRVFEKFFRIRPIESRRGTGLGLAIAKGIVQMHNGRITAMNRPGGGASFRFSLPVTTASMDAQSVIPRAMSL